MNAALLRSVSPASCGFDRHGLRGLIVSSFVTRSAAQLRISSKGEVVASQRGFWIAANSRAPWLPPSSRRASRGVVAVRHWELVVTTNWRDVDIAELRALLTGTEQNCDQFPKLNPDGSIAEVSPVKLKRAIQHSFIVVAMYIRGELHEDYFPDRPQNEETPPSRSKRTLVAFARATSDRALTASIHDVAVAPSLQGRGIGRHLMHRMVREIGRYGIADIAVMADPQTKPFFRRCGFGSDILGSTAMMYTAKSDAMLLVPPTVQALRRKEIANSVASA